jgi:lipid-binding SYLF domain-containing protein
MIRTSRLFGATILALGILATSLTARPAQAATDQENLIARARITVDNLKRDKEFGNARDLIERARAVLIVPRLYKGAFFVGGEGGGGVLLARNGERGWSQPAFYNIGSASFGLQIGVQESEMVLIIMSQKALNAVMQDQFKIGADAGLTIVSLGSNVGGATTGAVGADIVTWASSSGAYAGVSLNGSIIKPDRDDDAAYYGRAVTTNQILAHQVANPHSSALIEALSTVR